MFFGPFMLKTSPPDQIPPSLRQHGGWWVVRYTALCSIHRKIFVDAQLLSKEGSGGLEYYYDMLLIALLEAHDEGAADFCRRHQRAPW
jgi:hypothetical protein